MAFLRIAVANSLNRYTDQRGKSGMDVSFVTPYYQLQIKEFEFL